MISKWAALKSLKALENEYFLERTHPFSSPVETWMFWLTRKVPPCQATLEGNVIEGGPASFLRSNANALRNSLIIIMTFNGGTETDPYLTDGNG